MTRSKGFTLLELLLVIAILAILAGAVGPSFISSAKLSLDASRKARFLTNYASITLAASMYLMSSDKMFVIRNDEQPNTYAEVTTDSGLGRLVDEGTLQAETCMYENIAGEARWFAMGVGPDTGATAKYSTITEKAESAGSAITSLPTTDAGIEFKLKTMSLDAIWEMIKAE